MIVVSDASPIINLAIINQLGLLPLLFGKVVIPRNVFDEVVVEGVGLPGARDIGQAEWVEVMQCQDQLLYQSLHLKLDPGEAEAIVLAIEIKADLLLMDEKMGRQFAADLHVPVMGLLGALRVAKSKGFITAIKPCLDRLIHDANFRVGKNLYREILEAEGEN